MNINSFSKLKKGATFIIESFKVAKDQELRLMELGILLKIKIKLLQKNNFGSSIIKCQGIKYALDNTITNQIIATQVRS